MRLPAVLLALALLPAAAVAEDEPAVATRTIDNPFREGWTTFRVVDAETRKGIPGAWLNDDSEEPHPLGTLHARPPVAVADEDGWIAGPEDDVRWSQYVGAPGYGTQSDPPELVELRRPVDLAVRLLDAIGRPVAGARLGYRLECGHCCDLVQALTDARGVAVLPGVDPSARGWIWPTADAVEGEDFYVDDFPGAPSWTPGDPPFTIHGRPAVPVEGRVLDVWGRPIEGAFVGNRGWHRGPWTRTDERGGVRLVGADGALQVDPTDDDFDPARRVPEPAPGVPVVVRLDGKTLLAPETVAWSVRVVERGTGRAAQGLVVTAARRADGWADSTLADEAGVARLRVAAGMQRLFLGNEASAWQARRLEVLVAGPTETVVEVEACPEVRVDAGTVPEDGVVELCSASGARDVTAEARAGRVRAAVGPELALRAWTGWVVDPPTYVRLPSVREPGAAPLRIAWPGPVEVRLRVVDGAGEPVRAWAHTRKGISIGDAVGPASDLTVLARAPGPTWMLVMPERDDLAAIRVAFPVPSGEGAFRADLGTVVLPARSSRALRLVGADGAPEEGSFARPLEEDALAWYGAEGRSGGLDLEPGLAVLVENGAPGLLPYVRRLEGNGPWTLRRPAGRIEVVATEADGSPVGGFVVHVDGEEFLGEAGRCEVRGLDAGRHRVVVSRPDRPKAVEIRFSLKEGETRRVEATLPPRPEGE